MPLDLIIRGGKVVRRGGVDELSIGIENGTVVELAPEVCGAANEEIDASGLHIFPGLIDPHVHFNEPGRTDWEGITTGSSALAAGGGTLYFDMPLNSSPPVLDGQAFDAKLELAKVKSLTDFGIWGGLTPKNLDRMEELAERGVVGFKAFMCPSGIREFPHADRDTLLAGMGRAAKLGLPVAVHAEAPDGLERYRATVTGKTWSDYLASRPVVCESAATQTAIECAVQTGCALHVVHVSSSKVVGLIGDSSRRGANVTCETCPHYFLLCDEDLPTIGARAKCSPPVRSRAEGEMLTVALQNHDIDFIASDHSPAPPSMKTGDDAFAVWGGIAGVQSTLAAMLKLWSNDRAPLKLLPDLIAGHAAQRFNILRKGKIEVGFDADLTFVDLKAQYTLTKEQLLDRHKLSPYVGHRFRGKIRRTLVRGVSVCLDGTIISKPIGRLVRPA